jgi:hypothetical protein
MTGVDYQQRRGDIRVIKDNAPLVMDVGTPTLDRAEQGEIDTKTSYAEDAAGNRYRVIADKRPYTESLPNFGTYYLTRDLWRVSPAGKRVSWPNGEWHLHIERLSPHGRETYDTRFRLYFWLWTPFAGPPV